MPVLLIRHQVLDYSTWRAEFDTQGDTRRANGSRGGRLFRNLANSNELFALFEWDRLDRARLFAQSDDLRESIARAGVTGVPDLVFLEETDRLIV